MHTLPGGPLEDDPYRGHDDVVAMQGFTAQLVSVDPFAANLHPGDIPHFYSGLREHDLGELVRVWRRDGEIVAWAAVYPEQHVMDFLHHPKDREAADAAVEWAIQTYADQGGSGDLETEAAEGDASRQHLLSQHGFAESGNPYVVTRRPLSDQVPDISSPGYTVRAVTGLHEAAALAEVHNHSFRRQWTEESYRRRMQAPDYEPERELVVEAADGSLAAFCVIWFDDVNAVGLFEPVGVHDAHRRRGLGKAVMAEGLRRMAAAGMTAAEVVYEEGNQGAKALYTSMGFARHLRSVGWKLSRGSSRTAGEGDSPDP